MSRSARSLPFLSGAALLVLAAGCNLFLAPDCTTEIAFQVRPGELSLTVGRQASVNLYTTTCGGRERVRASAFWFSSDESVAIVDAGGIVRGVAAGTARVRAAQDEHGHHLVGEILVVVTPSD
jgi:hypothetical protein